MRNIIITITSLIVSITTLELIFKNLAFSITMGIIIGIVVFILLTKSAMKSLQELNNKAQKAIEKRNLDRAVTIYEYGLELRKKSPFIAGQLYAMIGMIYYLQKKYDKAIPNLQKASAMQWMSKGMLAIIYMNRQQFPEMEASFKDMMASGKRNPLAWALQAYCLDKIKRRQEAIDILNKGIKKVKSGQDLLNKNLLELQNGKKMRMRHYGESWYQFMLETPKMNQQANMGNPMYGKINKRSLYRGR